MSHATKYSGAEWIRRAKKIEPSRLGLRVADLLGQVYRGIYHIEDAALKVDWTNEQVMMINLPGSLSTYDSDELTTLVVLCHDAGMRLTIRPAGPTHLKLLFHQRFVRDDGNYSERMPTLEQHAADIRAVLGGFVEFPDSAAVEVPA